MDHPRQRPRLAKGFHKSPVLARRNRSCILSRLLPRSRRTLVVFLRENESRNRVRASTNPVTSVYFGQLCVTSSTAYPAATDPTDLLARAADSRISRAVSRVSRREFPKTVWKCSALRLKGRLDSSFPANFHVRIPRELSCSSKELRGIL